MDKMELVDIFKKRTRNPFRPRSSDIIDRIFPDFRPLEGVKGSLIAGTCNFYDKELYIIAQQKPKPADLKSQEDLNKRNYGMLTSDDHSLILTLIEKAKRQDPDKAFVFCLVDTYGADISMESAQHFQAFFIAQLIREFLTIPLRTISLVIGEGGSGGALAIQFTDIRGQMEDALYTTATPETMASIVFRDTTRINDALTILKPTAKELKNLDVIDRIVPTPDDLTDYQEISDNIRQFLLKAMKDLSKSRISRLKKKRVARARKYGVNKETGAFHDIKRYFEMPIKKFFFRPPPDIKILNYSSIIEVSDDYGKIEYEEKTQEYIQCGDGQNPQGGNKGCGRLIPLEVFHDNFQVCPDCGYSYILNATGWLACLTDEGSFHELYRNITVDQLLDEDMITHHYRDFLKRQDGRSNFKESLVVGNAKICHFPAVLAISEFYFCGGSMGVVFGEKFSRAVDFAIEENLPFISLCCSGGARLYEGISALMQMVKTIEAVTRLKQNGLPYISILADPSTGGAIASYAALGDIIIAEPGALIIFTGPRVMKSRGFEVDERLVRSQSLHEISENIYNKLDYYHDIRGIQEISTRKNMKATIAKYLELYHRTNYRKKKSRK